MAIETNFYYVIFKNECGKLYSEDEVSEIMETDDNAIECGSVDEVILNEELPWLLSCLSEEDREKLKEVSEKIKMW